MLPSKAFRSAFVVALKIFSISVLIFLYSGSIEDGSWGCNEGHNKKYNFTIKKADVREKLPYPDNSFDRVFCINVIERMSTGDEAKRSVKEMVRVLKPNGLLVITLDESLFQKEIVGAAGIPYYGDYDFSKYDTEKPYHVLGMIFVKEKGKPSEKPKEKAEKKEKETKEEEKEKGSPAPPQKEKEEMNKLEVEAGKGELPPDKFERLKELKKKLKKKFTRSLRERLVAINGLSDKCTDEILEEYKNLDRIKAAIKNKSFSVGAVGPEKQKKILKLRS